MLSTLHFFQTCKRVEKKKEKQARDLRCGEGTSSERERERRRKNKEDSKKEGERKTLFYSFIIIQTRRTLTTRQRSCRTLRPRSSSSSSSSAQIHKILFHPFPSSSGFLLTSVSNVAEKKKKDVSPALTFASSFCRFIIYSLRTAASLSGAKKLDEATNNAN